MASTTVARSRNTSSAIKPLRTNSPGTAAKRMMASKTAAATKPLRNTPPSYNSQHQTTASPRIKPRQSLRSGVTGSTSQITRSASTSSRTSSSSSSLRYSEYSSSNTPAAQLKKLSITDNNTTTKKQLVGLQNLGNTCFMNSVLQCVNSIPSLANFFLEDKHLRELNTTNSSTKGNLASVFGSLVQNLWNNRPFSATTPTEFKAVIGKFASRFLGYDQQDAQEFLRYFLDGLHEDLNRITEKPPYYEIKDPEEGSTILDREISDEYWKYYVDRNSSAPSDLFTGQVVSQVVCDICSHRSVCFDVFWDLSVPLPKKKRPSLSSSPSNSTSSRSSFKSRLSFSSSSSSTIKIEDCLKTYTEEEHLASEDAYYCKKCKTHRPVTKTLSIYRAPEILVIHLKRFEFSSFSRTKVSNPVSFPSTGLCLDEYAAADCVMEKGVQYDLTGVVNHMGSLNGGHYTADCLNSSTEEWYNYNDSTVSQLSGGPKLNSANAYILFYKRRRGEKNTSSKL